MTIEEKETYLLKPNYSARDIMALLNVKKTRATAIMKELREVYGGAIYGRSTLVTSKSFWLREGTTREEEMRIIAYAKVRKKLHH